jgi:glycosyltransferase involved in cell wall biosynthesis
LLSAAGPQLLGLINVGRDPKKASCVIPMAADPEFYPQDRDNCRKKLNLPNAFLVGYLGSLHPNRDPKQFFSIVLFTVQIDPTIKFVISGKMHSSITIPEEIKPHIVELGYITDADVPTAFNAMDILLAIGQPSKFGDYAYPVKIYEGLICGKIVMATRTQSTEWILKDTPENLIAWRDEKNTAEKIVSRKLIHLKQEPTNNTWEGNLNILAKYLQGEH